MGWSIETNATDGGWIFSMASSISSENFPIPSNGTMGIAGTNDDSCNCDKSNDFLITPSIDLSNQTSMVLKFDAHYLDNYYLGSQEYLTVELSTDDGNSWAEIEHLHGHGGWDTHTIDLFEYLGEENVKIGFRYNDGAGWLYGCGIDNVILKVPPTIEAEMISITSFIDGEVESALPIEGVILNNGLDNITSLEISYSVNGNSPIIETIEGLNVESFNYYTFELSSVWTPSLPGVYNVEVTILKVNGENDEDESNNSTSFNPEIYELLTVPDKIIDLISFDPVILEIEGISSMLDKPTDLDFFPLLGKNELWVLNQRVESTGGSTVTVSNATTNNPEFAHKVDGNTRHFMSMPTGIAFSSENHNFATSPGIQDANHNGGTYTGPTLWSSDPAIYAQDSGGNGSHLDMIHGSPFSMGIAHEVDNVFWVYDDWHSDIVRYDFAEDHGPGNDNHDDGRVNRYENIGIVKEGDIPNHMILDKTSGWLYFVDNGNNRVIRLDINTGIGVAIPLLNELLAEHTTVNDFDYEVIISTGLNKPSGIEIFEGKLLVGNYETGDIIVYNLENDSFDELGVIATNSEGLTGIKVGPDGNIWCVNRIENKLLKLSPSSMVKVDNLNKKVNLIVSPNPSFGMLNVKLPSTVDLEGCHLLIKALDGKIVYRNIINSRDQDVDLSNLEKGLYLIELKGTSFYGVEKIILQ